jgi:hypothetical protein
MAEIFEFSKNKTKKEEEQIASEHSKHDYVLDACEEVFPYGAVVLAFTETGSVQVSATVEDTRDIVEGLISAALFINRQEKDDA